VTALAFESAGKRVGSLSVNFIRLVIAFFLLSAFCWITRGLALPVDASGHAWFWLALSGIIGFTVGDLCLFRALVVIGARVSMLLMALVPPMTAIIGWSLMGESLAPKDWAGMALTLGGVAWVILERKPAGEAAELPARDRLAGVMLGLGGAAGQAVGLVLSKYGMGEDMNPFAATQIRIIAGAAGFAAIFVVIRWWSRVGAALKNRPAMARMSLGAVFGPFLGVSLSLLAVKHTNTGVAATIMSVVPVLIIAPSVLIKKEKVSARAAIGAVVAVCGVAVMFLEP
jgi:drug/metabolite transporter (DMT)-like permease